MPLSTPSRRSGWKHIHSNLYLNLASLPSKGIQNSTARRAGETSEIDAIFDEDRQQISVYCTHESTETGTLALEVDQEGHCQSSTMEATPTQAD